MRRVEQHTGGRPRDVVPFGLIGLGYGGRNLERHRAELPAVEIAYLCDLRPEVLELMSRRYPGVPYSTNFEKVLGNSSIDAVIIATPVSTHHSLALSALAAGKHVFVEKPLAA